jgi:glycosyltransferase involved in cell wall biosynthesis
VLRIGEAAPLRTVVGWLFGSLDAEVERRARWAVAGASAVVSNSHAAVETYRAEGYEGRFAVVPTGVVGPVRPDGPERQECRRRLGIGPDQRVLLYPASLWPIKGQWVLLSALALARRRHPSLGCVLIGHADAVSARVFRALVERNGLSGAVRICPFAADLGPWWSAADVIVCASESEAMPAAVLEGMARGLPALASRVGDLPRLIEPEVNGWLCDHSDVAAMAQALEAVACTSPEELQRMGDAARTSVARLHDQARASDRWVELLRSAAG